jgi:hypothetical protein
MSPRLFTFPAVTLIVLACSAAARPSDWTLLGQRPVTDRVDHDAIAVAASEGRFAAIQLRVQRAAVDFHRVVIHFRNGQTQEVELRTTIGAGQATRRIELQGPERLIARVDFWYDARTARGRQAVVRLFGER